MSDSHSLDSNTLMLGAAAIGLIYVFRAQLGAMVVNTATGIIGGAASAAGSAVTGAISTDLTPAAASLTTAQIDTANANLGLPALNEAQGNIDFAAGDYLSAAAELTASQFFNLVYSSLSDPTAQQDAASAWGISAANAATW